MKRVAVLVGLFVFFVVAVAACSNNRGASQSTTNCNLNDVAVEVNRVRFVDNCRLSPCLYMTGVATLDNRCVKPVGVEVEITGYDKSGVPVANRRLWPFSTENVPRGKSVFSLDHYLDYDPQIKTFSVRPVQVHTW